MTSTQTIEIKDLKDGDIILYELKNAPEFKLPITKDNISENFSALVDKLICFAEGTNITHAALMYGPDTVVEATLPYCRVRTPVLDPSFHCHVRRIGNGKDGSAVLKYLPQPKEEVEKDPESYAMMMAAVAALSCLFKAKIGKNDNSALLLAIIRCVLYKVAEFLDNQKMPYASGEENWFCSQLAYYAYTKAAVDLKDNAYEIKLADSSTPLDQSLIHKLINMKARVNALPDEKILLKKPAKYDRLYSMANDFFSQKKRRGLLARIRSRRKPAAEDVSFIFNFMKKICGNDFNFSDIENELIKFQSAFVMPSDLMNCLDEGYTVKDE